MKHQLKRGPVPELLADAYAAGKTIVIAGRFSKERAFIEAVNDFLSAAEYLADLGVDIRPAIGSADGLVAQLRATVPVNSTEGSGKVFKNWFLRIDLRATHGVVCLISCGTGKKLDDLDTQPFVNRLAEEVRETNAVVVVGTRIDRLTRKAWSFGPVMLALDRTGGYLADKRRGVMRVDGTDSVMTFFSAQAAEDEADKMPAQLARGMHTGTDSEMVDGRCRIGVGRPVPPGLFTYRAKVNGSIGPRMMTFDTPACIPDDRDVAAGRPEVYDANGQHVDQVANVRWLLSTMGKPGWTYRTLSEELIRRYFSTDYFRKRNGMDARFVNDFDHSSVKPREFLNTILENLDFYETGVLRINTGVAGYETIIINNCMPRDGEPWATPEDFRRIHEWLGKVRRSTPRGLTFANMAALVDGSECVLIARSHVRTDGSRRYSLWATLAAPYRDGCRVTSPPTTISLPPELLNNALGQALINAGESAYAMLEASGLERIDERVQREVRAAEIRVHDLQIERDGLRRQLNERTPDGRMALSGSLLKEVNDRFNQLSEELIPQAQLLVDQSGDALRAAVDEQRSRRDGLALEHVLSLVATLRDPHNITYRDFIHSSVRNLTVTTRHRRVNNRSLRHLTVTFDFIIREGDRVLVVPVVTEHIEGVVLSEWETGDRILRELQSRQTTFNEVVPKNKRAAISALNARLNLNGRHMMLPRVADPRLSHLVALVLDNGDLEKIAQSTGEPLELVERVYEVHRQSTRAYWVSSLGPRIAALHRAADATGSIKITDGAPAPLERWNGIHQIMNNYRDADQWSYDKKAKEWRLSPCPHCGGTRRRPASIPEPDGLVCLDCRRDSAGHLWDHRFDPYLDGGGSDLTVSDH